MDEEKERQLAKLLEDYDLHGVKFPQAKHELLSQGYTEAEIIYALYSSPFDGKANVPLPPNPLQEMYAHDPVKADRIAKLLLSEQRQMDWDKTVADTAAASASPDIHSRSHYGVRAADDLGVPYFSLLFGGFVLFIIAIKFGWPQATTHIVFVIYQVLINAIFLYKLIQKRRQLKKLK